MKATLILINYNYHFHLNFIIKLNDLIETDIVNFLTINIDKERQDEVWIYMQSLKVIGLL